jgi:F-type H+-transporting ATPase subunit b
MEYHALVLHFWSTGTFWVAVAVVIFFLAVGGKIWTLLMAVLDKRAVEIRAALDEAARLKTEAEAMLDAAKRRQAQAEADAKDILESARAEAARMAADLTKEAEALAKWRERMAVERIAAAEAAAIAEVRTAAIDIAAAAARHLLRDHFDAESDTALIDQAIAGTPEALRATV